MENISNKSEAPSILTPLENANILEYEIDKQIKFKAEFNNNIIRLMVIELTIPQKDYELLLTLEQMCKINRFFVNFENTNDLANWIINSFKEKNSSIKFIDNKCIIQMKNPISNKTFELILNKEQKDLNSRINNLEAIIIEQNKKIISLEERIKKLEDFLSYDLAKSEILNKSQQDMVINWLPGKASKINLLMNSNLDGDSTKTFMNKCKGKSPTLAVIQTANGKIFGGYTTQMWKEGEVKDNGAFVFSIDKQKKYKIKQPDLAIGFGKNSWWGFGSRHNAIVIVENCTTRDGNWVGNETYDIPEPYELNGGEKNFTVKSFEIYYVDY